MTGPEHYAEAERLLVLADRPTRGVTYEQEWTLALTAAQVHATLALAAATAVGPAGTDGHAWADVAATRLSARKPDPSPDSPPGPGPLLPFSRPGDDFGRPWSASAVNIRKTWSFHRTERYDLLPYERVARRSIEVIQAGQSPDVGRLRTPDGDATTAVTAAVVKVSTSGSWSLRTKNGVTLLLGGRIWQALIRGRSDLGVQMADSSREDSSSETIRQPDPAPSWRSRLRAVWDDTSQPLQNAWIDLWSIGLILLGLGMLGDRFQFWEQKSYLVNLFSALTGAAFGIPLALVVLQRITTAEADAAEARAADRMAVAVSSRLAAAARALVKDEANADSAILKLRAARTHLRNQRDMAPNEKHSYKDFAMVRGSDLQLQSYIDGLEDASFYFDDLWHESMPLLYAEVATQWSILSTVARSRLLETNGEWLIGAQEIKLNELVGRVSEQTLGYLQGMKLGVLDTLRQLLDPKRNDGMVNYIDIVHAIKDFNNWFEAILHFIEDVENLIGESAVVERKFRNHLNDTSVLK